MSQSPTELREFAYESSYTEAAAQLNKLVRAGKSYSGHERNRCFLNVEGQQFANVSMISGFDFAEDGRAIAVCDWDGDGDQDFWIANRTAPQIRLMQNRIGHKNRSVRFRLRGTESNRDAVGARVTVQLSPTSSKLHRTLRAGEGFLSCHSKELSFGVGQAQHVELVTVRWPSGETETFKEANLTGRTYLLEEGTGQAQLIREHATNLEAQGSNNTGQLTIPPQTMATHNVLLQPVPMPPLTYESSDGTLLDASVNSDKPTLINLWAAWCMPCLQELSAWSKSHAELKQHVNLLPLSVDKLPKAELPTNQSSGTALSADATSEPRTADVLMQVGYRGPYGWATPSLLDVLQQTHNVIYDHHRPLPLPCSFLLDRAGNLRAVYKGAVEPDRILKDVASITNGADKQQSLPFKGRWMGPLGSHNLQLLVEELYREGYEKESIAYVERLTDETFQKRQIGARLFLAQQLAMSDPASAVRQANAVLTKSPDNAGAHERLGLLYARARKPQQASHHFVQAIENQTEPQPRTHYNFGKLLRSQGSLTEAWEQFKKAIEADDRFDPAYEQLGLIQASQRRFTEASQLFAVAVRLQPSKATYRVNQAMALSQLKRNEDAWKAIEPVIQRDDVPPMALLLGARSLGNLSRFAEAIPLLERFLVKQPDANDVRSQLAFMREQAQEKSQAGTKP